MTLANIRDQRVRTINVTEGGLEIIFEGISNLIPVDGEWHTIVFVGNANEIDELSIDGEPIIHNVTLDENDIREVYTEGIADRALSEEEVKAMKELLMNHPEIKSWRLKNNILYLEIDDLEEGVEE